MPGRFLNRSGRPARRRGKTYTMKTEYRNWQIRVRRDRVLGGLVVTAQRRIELRMHHGTPVHEAVDRVKSWIDQAETDEVKLGCTCSIIT